MNLNFTPDELKKLAAALENDESGLADKLRKAAFPERLVNLTGHTINIYNCNGVLTKVIPPDPVYPVCRVNDKKTITKTVCGVPFWESTYPSLSNLPSPEPNTYFIVSRMVAYATEPRDDLLVIDMQVKDDNGRTIGCRGLTRV